MWCIVDRDPRVSSDKGIEANLAFGASFLGTYRLALLACQKFKVSWLRRHIKEGGIKVSDYRTALADSEVVKKDRDVFEPRAAYVDDANTQLINAQP
ncbi:hypothetical protein [Actinomadura sp. BRA 177]|uniref:hypothetical protein n=1 Tax=Actinomadura sp. BRA 177 TaxID=2745202 RepID=UPI0020CE865F|nr:hypothetical protein [Actinomadura sp. BRA 177]